MNPDADHIRCHLCSKKFTSDLEGCSRRIQHQGSESCLRRQMKNSMAQRIPPDLSASAKISLPLIPGSDLAQQKSSVYAAVLGETGSWCQRCELCEGIVLLGRSLKGGQFETHQNGRKCRKGQRRLQLNTTHVRTSSTPTLIHPQSSRLPGRSVPVSPSPLVALQDTSNIAELRPSDASTKTLARDIIRALSNDKAKKRKYDETKDVNSKKLKTPLLL